MTELIQYIREHTAIVSPTTNSIGNGFFHILPENNPDADTLKKLITSNPNGVFGGVLNPFDGDEHSYIEIGGWIGSQEVALSLMALGEHLKLWVLLTPEKVLPLIPPEIQRAMAERGLVTIKTYPSKNDMH